VAFADLAPVIHGRAAHGVGPDPDARLADGVQVQDGGQIVHIAAQEIELSGGLGLEGLGQRNPLHAAEPVLQQFVGAVGDPARSVGVGRAAVRRVVLEAAVGRRVVAGGDNNAISLRCSGRGAAVVREDGVAQGRGGGVAVPRVDEDVHAVCGKHLKGGVLRRFAQPVGVLGQEQRAGDALPGAVFHDRLRDRHNVTLVEGRFQARAAVPGGSERHALAGIPQVRLDVVVRVEQCGQVDKVLGLGNCARSASHGTSMPDDGEGQHGVSGIRPL
jgi:hypothetical protein